MSGSAILLCAKINTGVRRMKGRSERKETLERYRLSQSGGPASDTASFDFPLLPGSSSRMTTELMEGLSNPSPICTDSIPSGFKQFRGQDSSLGGTISPPANSGFAADG